MAEIRVNDIFDELVEENEKITECLNVLIRFKTFIDLISDEMKNNLQSKRLQMFDDYHKEVEEVFIRNEMEFTVNRNLIQRKSQLVESSKPPKSDEIKQQLSSDQTIESTKRVNNKSSKAMKLRKKSSRNQKKTNEDLLMSDENQRFVCSFIGCGKQMKRKDSLRLHLKRHSSVPKTHKCHFEGCSFSTFGRTQLSDHINSHNGVRPFNCEFCPKRFTSTELKKRHTNYHHKVSDQTLICQMDECYKQFKTELSLKDHQKRIHLWEKRFACSQPNCAFKAINKSSLKTHMFNVHSDERPFVCDFEGCSKSYKSSQQLNIHIENHSSERKYKCLSDDCEKTFKSANSLRVHTLWTHSSQLLSCDWPGCEYTCKNRQCLRNHQVVHTSERKFLCVWPQCGKAFKNKSYLDKHLRIHSNDRRYVCSWPGCQYRCTDSGNIIKHKKIHNKN